MIHKEPKNINEVLENWMQESDSNRFTAINEQKTAYWLGRFDAYRHARCLLDPAYLQQVGEWFLESVAYTPEEYKDSYEFDSDEEDEDEDEDEDDE